MGRYIGYIRKSPSKKEASVESSIEDQQQAIDEWADTYDHTIVDCVIAEEVSARKHLPWDDERWRFVWACAWAIEDEEIDGIVARNPSRYTRTMVGVQLPLLMAEHFRLRWGYEETEIEFCLTDTPGLEQIPRIVRTENARDMGNYHMLAALFGQADMEARQTVERTNAALERKDRRAEPRGTPPRGLTTDKREHNDVERASTYLPGENYALVVETLNQWLRDPEGHSATTLGREFDDDNPYNAFRAVRDNYPKYLQAQDAGDTGDAPELEPWPSTESHPEWSEGWMAVYEEHV
ncbi:recombinase family protein [Haloglomus salinum]|uniref:recombinase family protein n=1 Tax=Haloglomus salinum TaxID=2962673 RepID=UPI0020C9D3BD|nr:recombinase family protein [Haloglomus salinum]